MALGAVSWIGARPPFAELLGELGRGPEDHARGELVLSIGLRVPARSLPVDDPEISQVPGAVRPELVRGSGGAVGAITAIGACNISGRRGFIDGPHMHFCVARQLGCLP